MNRNLGIIIDINYIKTSILCFFVHLFYVSFSSPLFSLSPSSFISFTSFHIYFVSAFCFLLFVSNILSCFSFLSCLSLSISEFISFSLLYVHLTSSLLYYYVFSQLRMCTVLWHLTLLQINEELGASNVSDQQAVVDVSQRTNPPVILNSSQSNFP